MKPIFKIQFLFLCVVVALLSMGTQSGFGQTAPPLNFGNNLFVTGDYIVAGAQNMNKTFSNGYAVGTITIPDPNPGITGIKQVPAGAQIVDAILYWQTVEKTGVAPGAPGSGQNGYFRPLGVTGGPAAPRVFHQWSKRLQPQQRQLEQWRLQRHLHRKASSNLSHGRCWLAAAGCQRQCFDKRPVRSSAPKCQQQQYSSDSGRNSCRHLSGRHKRSREGCSAGCSSDLRGRICPHSGQLEYAANDIGLLPARERPRWKCHQSADAHCQQRPEQQISKRLLEGPVAPLSLRGIEPPISRVLRHVG